MAGPLAGVRVVEMVGIGPCPFAAMMLADMGAEVIRIDRKAAPGEDNPYPMLGTRHDVMARGRRSLALDGTVDEAFAQRWDKAQWPQQKERLVALFASRTREEWCRLLEGTDACFAPVLDMAEAPQHPHNAARRTFVEIDGVTQPAPAPRFSRTVPPTPAAPSSPGRDSDAILRDWGFTAESIEALRAAEVI